MAWTLWRWPCAPGHRPGDEVIVPSQTFIATWLAVSMVGATPVPVEIDPGTYGLDTSRIAAALTAKRRASCRFTYMAHRWT